MHDIDSSAWKEHDPKKKLVSVRLEISATSSQEHQGGKITRSACIRIPFGQEGNIFRISCSTGKFLLDFIKVIIPANLYLESITDCLNSRKLAYEVTTLPERRATAYMSNGGKASILPQLQRTN
jgi:hypothetical protein